jgi:hypothetical protein
MQLRGRSVGHCGHALPPQDLSAHFHMGSHCGMPSVILTSTKPVNSKTLSSINLSLNNLVTSGILFYQCKIDPSDHQQRLILLQQPSRPLIHLSHFPLTITLADGCYWLHFLERETQDGQHCAPICFHSLWCHTNRQRLQTSCCKPGGAMSPTKRSNSGSQGDHTWKVRGTTNS